MISSKSVKIQEDLVKSKPLIIAGIPAYNEERTIAKLILEAQKFVDIVLPATKTLPAPSPAIDIAWSALLPPRKVE